MAANNTSTASWLTKKNGGTFYTVPNLEGFNTEDRGLNDRFANEDGQNRCDAINDKSKPVIVKIEEKIIDNKIFYKNYIEGLEKNLENTNNRKYKTDPKKIKVIIVECFNTVGLTGSQDSDSDNDNYERFFAGSAESKTGSSGGRRQLGRHCYMLASSLKGMFAYSIEKKTNTRMLRGVQFLGKWSKDNKKMDPYSSYTRKYNEAEYQNEEETFPILEKNNLDEFKNIVGLSRKDNECGLSIVIPEPIESISIKKIFNSYIKRFYPALLTNSLKIEYKTKDKHEFIDSSNVKKKLLELDHVSEKWINFFDQSYTSSDKDQHFVLDLEKYNYQESLKKDDFPEEIISKIKSDYLSNKIILIKSFVKIPFDKKNKQGEKSGYFYASLNKKSYDDKQISALYLRGSLLIPGEKRNFHYSKNTYAAIWIEDENLNELLGDSEGMAHDSWNSKHTDVGDFYGKEVQQVFKYIKGFLDNLFSIITNKDSQIDFDTFADDLPTIEDIYKEEEVQRKEIIIPDDTEVPKEEKDDFDYRVLGMKKMVQEIPVEGGFKIIKTDACGEENFPMKVRIKFAYRTRGKNSFNSYNKK